MSYVAPSIDKFHSPIILVHDHNGTAGPNGVNPCPASQANPGCIAVFAPAPALAPEPGSLPLLVVGLVGLMGLAVRRRVHHSG
jgi:hypothetical protein